MVKEIVVSYLSEIKMPDGGRILLVYVDKDTKLPNPNCNVCRLTPEGFMKWQISSPQGIIPQSPYTNIEMDGTRLVAHWNNNMYYVNIANGEIMGRKMAPPKRIEGYVPETESPPLKPMSTVVPVPTNKLPVSGVVKPPLSPNLQKPIQVPPPKINISSKGNYPKPTNR